MASSSSGESAPISNPLRMHLTGRGAANAVVNDTPVYTKPEEAIVVTRILEAIYESAKTGKPVYFND